MSCFYTDFLYGQRPRIISRSWPQLISLPGFLDACVLGTVMKPIVTYPSIFSHQLCSSAPQKALPQPVTLTTRVSATAGTCDRGA